ncbi:MAG: beta-propeller domain-containing protein [Methanoregula sp.]
MIAFLRLHTEYAAASSSPAAFPAFIPGATRWFSYDVDTSSFKPDEYLVTVQAVKELTADSALFNVLEGPARQSMVTPTMTPSPRVTDKNGYYISINPIGDHFIGEKFSITGTTNIPADADLLVQVVSSSFKPTQKSQSGEFSGRAGTIRTSSSAPSIPAPVPTIAAVHTAAPTLARTVVPTTAATSARDFSTTNVQVKQVDEADIIKTDGKNIYVVTKNCLNILRAYPAVDAGILSTLRFAGHPEALYINGDKLVLIANDYQTRPITECTPGSCTRNPMSTQRTLVYVFSARSPENPVLLRELDIDGSYTSSRMIGSQVYFVTSLNIPRQLDDLELPTIHDDLGGITTPPVYGFNTRDQAFAFSTISSLDIADTSPVQAKSFIIGSAGTIYVSPTTLYIALPDTDMDRPRGSTSTAIYSFTISDGKIGYSAAGKVDGTLLNQYSLDEYEGNLRVATTVDTLSGRWNSASSSKVTVMDKRLNSIGSLSDIAPGERIYAARFMGDRLYLVTFRQTDPFYVIGLQNPGRPVILGELKIPGFSNYLHPYDAAHIIGIGKESQSGPVKIALFDVTDVNKPGLVDSESLGGPGSDSPVLTDPKAFLFDREKNLLVLPIHWQDKYCSFNGPCPNQQAWEGAYVFGVTPKSGFVLKGTVIHNDRYSGNPAPVKRALYIEDTLYTMSDAQIIMSDLARSLDRINEINFT